MTEPNPERVAAARRVLLDAVMATDPHASPEANERALNLAMDDLVRSGAVDTHGLSDDEIIRWVPLVQACYDLVQRLAFRASVVVPGMTMATVIAQTREEFDHEGD